MCVDADARGRSDGDASCTCLIRGAQLSDAGRAARAFFEPTSARSCAFSNFNGVGLRGVDSPALLRAREGELSSIEGTWASAAIYGPSSELINR